EKLDKSGLACSSMHVGLDNFYNDLDKVISDAVTIGAQIVSIPWMEAELEADVLKMVNFVRENAAKVSENGLKWTYHNHAHEFKPLDTGKDFFDVLLDNTDASQINLQVDTYWVEQADVPVTGFIEKYKARIGGFHLKDHREVGAGDIDFPAVLKAAKELGQEWLVVEQEEFEADPFDCIRVSYNNVRKIEETHFTAP
ncbi:MAG: sugar phosphate isomerase/epimerase, partial [Defluviitaleaceae bacterium]|nr:sugar phosphate isomerase/epimerase [Defluviitaleaceae bacterium]